ncbi:MAG: acetate kinase [Elusimicrobia bacterium]|nr:acetate kinase [Elusimicrobiota bacterium]
MRILVLNCGSSSIKYSIFDRDLNRIARGSVERISSKDACVLSYRSDEPESKEICNIPDHKTALEYILGHIEKGSITAVGHRVVHGGEKLRNSVPVTDAVKQEIKKCFQLAPLHNPHNLSGIEMIEKILPGAKNIAVFDTAFHSTIPRYSYLYALPYYLYRKYTIRRFGFHGISHRYVSMTAAGILGKEMTDINIITCHLGNGCSITAVKKGCVVDTSMGFTPLEGLIMGTRCGDIDPAIVPYLMASEGLTLSEINTLLTGQSGLYGISGISNDMKTLIDEAAAGNERAQLAIDMFTYRVRKYIGAYYAVLGKVDAIVFTAGIGEKSPLIRSKSLDDLQGMGIILDRALNSTVSSGVISAGGSATKVMVIPTDEELIIAREVMPFL